MTTSRFRGCSTRMRVSVVAVLCASAVMAATAQADSPVYADDDGVCGGLSPCLTTIQAAVNNATDPDGAGSQAAQVFVFPGLYAESVDLSGMGGAVGGTAGDISLITVNVGGTPTPGTAIIDPGVPGGPGSGQAIRHFFSPFPGDVTINGFIVNSPDGDGIDLDVVGDVLIENVAANGVGDGVTADDGVHATSQAGNVTVRDTTASSNGGGGTSGSGLRLTTTVGNVTVEDCTTNGNDNDGVWANAGGNLSISGTEAVGNAGGGVDCDGIDAGAFGNMTFTDCHVEGNGDDGLDLFVNGSVTITRLTALNNGASSPLGDGVEIGELTAGNHVDNVTVQDSRIQGNAGAGVNLVQLAGSGTFRVIRSIICANTNAGIGLNTAVPLDAEGNWWGDASGPTHPTNPAGTGQIVYDGANGASGTIDFNPWITTVTTSATVNPVIAGHYTTLSFQFSGGGGAVFLGQGPGTLLTALPFTLTTDNGNLVASSGGGPTVTEAINAANGTLSIPLRPDNQGTATVNLTGPCGLAASVSVGVSGPACGGMCGVAGMGALPLMALGLGLMKLRLARGRRNRRTRSGG